MADKAIMTPGAVLTFLRKRDYIFIKELGQGACGQSVLLKDDTIDSYFVCKKYIPYAEEERQNLYDNFVREIKLLHNLYHTNVVRVFNYYLYPDNMAGFILMEYVDGWDVGQYLRANPDEAEAIFLQAVEGFSYLEKSSILHRDIRPENILVRKDGILKIIDLGFGKHIINASDFGKSITLNWHCEPPDDFLTNIYNHSTEVYFVGNLFEGIIEDVNIKDFRFLSILKKMTQKKPESRFATFLEVQTAILVGKQDELVFSDEEKKAYQEFADVFLRHLLLIEASSKYRDNLDEIKAGLDSIYTKCMLETQVPNFASIATLFIWGGYKYRANGFPTSKLAAFRKLFRECSIEKQKITIANLCARFDSIKRYTHFPDDDEIPF